MPNLNLLVKPASSKCNLNCTYCFYNKIANDRKEKDYGFMKIETMKNIFIKADNYCQGGNCHIGFQGGEPLLIGIEFYENLITISKQFNTNFSFSIQTNGLLINETWAKFFKTNNFLVGLSIDGIKKIHDKYRFKHDHFTSYDQCLKAIKILKDKKVEFNSLCVVTSELTKHTNQVFKTLSKDNKYLQFIPVIANTSDEFALKPGQYGRFLVGLFDLWIESFNKQQPVSIRYFDNLLSLILGYDYESCDMRGFCSLQNIIESNGNIYPCDFYCYDNFCLGNINDTSCHLAFEFKDILNLKIANDFIKSNISLNCKECRYFSLCRGGCKKYRSDNHFIFCQDYQYFFDKRLNKLIELAKRINKR